MKAFKDWISCQVASSTSLLSVRPLSDNFLGEAIDEESDDQGSALRSSLPETVPVDSFTRNAIDNQANEPSPPPQPPAVKDSQISHSIAAKNKTDSLAIVEALQINFLRVVHRLGHSPQNILVAQVLYRLQLACLIRAGESDIKRAMFRNDKAVAIAREQEAAGESDLDFSFKILLLGKTGVGKSATINSIFDQTKAVTSAFQPATDRIHEVVGSIDGIKVTIIDTPGFLPSDKNQRRNRKILLAVKRFIKRSKPDMVLYFERLDSINMGYSDFPLLKLITDILGSAVWFNTILVLTHSASVLPEGPDGYPVTYGGYVAQCTHVIQHYIHQVVNDTKLENQVLLVENHPLCKTNGNGEKILPNGQVWRTEFLLLCASSKVLGDANYLLKFQDSFPMKLPSTRTPSLPHLLSSVLRSHSGGPDEEQRELSDLDDEDEYDQLPPIRILKKSQFERLTKDQKNDYLDELDYREILYLKKQLKEELRRRRDNMLLKDQISRNKDNYENDSSEESVLLPDMTIPLSFDSDNPAHRYRCLVGYNDMWLVKPVLDSQGWDHEVGFDGINLEVSEDIKKNFHASVVGQMSKDKQDFSIQTECLATYTDMKGGRSLCGGLDIQKSGRDLVCTIRGDAKLRNLVNNVTGCGISVTSFGNKSFIGSKLEDTLSMGKRLKFVLNAGQMVGQGQVAHGGSFEATLKGKDYPMRNDKLSLAVTALFYDKETVFGGNIQSDFRPGRGTKMSVNVNLNSRSMGQVCVKTSSNDHVELGVLALYSILRAIFRRKGINENVPRNKERREEMD